MSENLVIEQEVDRTPLKQYFGIEDKYDSGFGEDFDYITNWAKEKGLSVEDMLLEVKKVEQKLGTGMPGESRWHRVKHYLSLDTKLTNTLKEMAAHERSWSSLI
jgi:hypothetical protein